MERSIATHEVAEQLFAQLVASLEHGDSVPLAAYLSALQRFHRYSFHNVMLILSQRPAATRVAGFHTWRSLHRHVRRGEKGIAILAPLVRRVRNDDNAEVSDSFRHVIYGWRTVYVFDVAQTDGESLPSYTMAETSGDVGPYYDRLVTLVRNLGITLTFVDNLGGALATCRPGHASIQLLSSLEPAAAFATLSHELAHDLLHRRDDLDTPASKNVREAEAEAVAAIVTEAIGLAHLDSARDYIRLYNGSADTLKASLGRIQHAATTILSALQEFETPEDTSEAASPAA
jgi:antirestriction protein ArdC